MNKQSLLEIYNRLIMNIENDLDIIVQLNEYSECDEIPYSENKITENIQAIKDGLNRLVEKFQYLQ